MIQHPQPRHFLPTTALAGAGLPNDRMAKVAARRAFVELKLTFLEAVRHLPDHRGDWLRLQVRSAEEPVDLWLLRAPLFAALTGPDPELRSQRLRLRRGLDSLFPDNEPVSVFGAF
jgi:hypothetical protein